MIPDTVKTNFNMLCTAIKNNDVALFECTDKSSGKIIFTVCAVNRSEDGQTFNMVPFAKMFDGNPYDELTPPSPEEAEKEAN